MAQPNEQVQIRKAIFADPQLEEYECTAGTSQLKQYLERRKLKKGFAVLSNLSVYCKGGCYVQKPGTALKKRLVEYRVDLSDINEVRYIRKNPTWLLSICLFFLILAPMFLILELALKLGTRTVLSPVLDTVVCLLLAGIFFVIYLLCRKTLLLIKYSNGSIALNSADLPDHEERSFLSHMRALIEAQEAAAAQYARQQAAYAQAYRTGYPTQQPPRNYPYN